jgi:hypothetical protein
MTVAFRSGKKPRTADELSAVERKQLESAWHAYAGERSSADALVEENSEWFELWRVERDGEHVLDFVHCPPDHGRMFLAGTARPAKISMIQFDFGGDAGDDESVPERFRSLLGELDAAWKRREKPGRKRR